MRRFGNSSPFTIGARPLIAKTCPSCGLLLQAEWFDRNGGGRKSICGRCRGAARGPRRKTDKERAQVRASVARYQAITLAGAHRTGYPWLEADMEVLRDPELTVLEKALLLNRTYKATVSACHVHECMSRIGLGDPEKEKWIIDNPNDPTRQLLSQK